MRFKNFISEILGDGVHLTCLRYLRHYPQGLSGRELARLAGVSQFKIRSVVQKLSREGLLIMHTAGRAHTYRLNTTHLLTVSLASLFELEEDFLTFLGNWVYERLPFKPLAIILYGSRARGDERPDSDIDLFFLYANEKDVTEKVLEEALEALDESVSVFGNRMSVTTSTPSTFKKEIQKGNPLFLQIQKEGASLHGKTLSAPVFIARARAMKTPLFFCNNISPKRNSWAMPLDSRRFSILKISSRIDRRE